MRQKWRHFTASFAVFAGGMRAKNIGRIYWAFIILLMAAVLAYGAYHAVVSQGAGIAHLAREDVTGFLREATLESLRDRRERGRIWDFSFVMWNLLENYPFLEMSARQGVDMPALWEYAMGDLYDVARLQYDHGFFMEFINENFLDHIGGLGGLALTAEGVLEAPWLMEPYFFGLHDPRFYDDRADIATLDNNLYTAVIGDNIAFMSAANFLSRGYEEITRRPYRRFDFDAEMQRVMAFYEEIEGFQHLIVDIRGNAEGFSEYFLPLILRPNMAEGAELMFYGFHMGGEFAHKVSEAFRSFYNLGETQAAYYFADALPYKNADDFEIFSYGFAIPIGAEPLFPSPAFDGNIWLLADTGSFSGANRMYLELAMAAGFNIVYEERADASGWPLSYSRMPFNRGLSLRYNPLYFTDSAGLSLEEHAPSPQFTAHEGMDGLETVMAVIADSPDF